jgi:uncharacterized protein YecE (DUF72 family)
MIEKNLHIGTSGWSYTDWKQLFYPPGTKSSDYLPYYATRFDCTEINSSFYRIPLKKTVEKWVDSTPDNFLFCPKLYQGITHYRKFKNSEELLANYFEVFSPMEKKMGPVLIQLPRSFAFHYDDIEAFFELLDSAYKKYRFAIETRHVSWYTEEALGLLSRFNIAHTISDAGEHHFPTHEAVTSTDIYIRFHGRQSLYSTDYKDEELKEYALKIRKWLKSKHKVWIFFNNTAFGYAIANAFKLHEMILS